MEGYRKYLSDFNPLPPRRGRRNTNEGIDYNGDFNPLPPRSGRPISYKVSSQFAYFNPLPPRRGRLVLRLKIYIQDRISIHSLLAEGDEGFAGLCRVPVISIHSLLAEGDWVTAIPANLSGISIHSLLAEGDTESLPRTRNAVHFNPLPPRRGRRDLDNKTYLEYDFNPLPPRRGRPQDQCLIWMTGQFQSTPSSQRETNVYCDFNASSAISIHSLLAEGDEDYEEVKRILSIFQSTPSSQRETREKLSKQIKARISIHSLLAEGDQKPRPLYPASQISIHSLLAEGD